MKTIKLKHSLATGGNLMPQQDGAKPGYSNGCATIAVTGLPDNAMHNDAKRVIDSVMMPQWLHIVDASQAGRNLYRARNLTPSQRADAPDWYKAKYIPTSATLIEMHGDDLNTTPDGYEQTIRQMLADEPDTEWVLIDSSKAPNGMDCPIYATAYVGQAGPVVMMIRDAVETGWETDGAAERILRDIGVDPLALLGDGSI